MFKQKLKQYMPFLFLLPSLIVFTIFMFWPVLRTFYLSFFSWNMIKPTKDFVGLDNYVSVLTDPITYQVIQNTFIYILILLVINFIAPYILSFVLSVVIKRFKGFYKTVYFMPSVISLVVGSVLYVWILNPISGPAAVIANYFNVAMPVWSKTEGLVIVVLSLITSWKIFGYNFIVILAGVSGVSDEIIEAAKMDNIPMHRIFIDIIVPMSSATGIYVFIMTIVQGLQYVFTPIKVITQGGPNYASSNVIYQVYQEAFGLYKTGTASALSMITMILFIVLLILEFKFVEKGVHYEN
ncbi:MAG: ABC transporter permease [Epulopiscium sp. Nele67-Bin002]|nr:MAG: ABC transporter permease [Epulopiscium sp. Nele67-Bin002]OON92149.1 MAG: ABC transporter permease [Epulopiscium sp. Nele67-Bin001]